MHAAMIPTPWLASTETTREREADRQQKGKERGKTGKV